VARKTEPPGRQAKSPAGENPHIRIWKPATLTDEIPIKEWEGYLQEVNIDMPAVEEELEPARY
jgi:hypothetical protein